VRGENEALIQFSGQRIFPSQNQCVNTKLKCSNCGAEISNLTLSWGKKQWLWALIAFVPIIIFGIVMFLIESPKGDFSKDLQTTLLETRYSTNRIDILGKIMNSGKRTWNNIDVKAEFYGNNGRFLDEESGYISGSVKPGEEENFRLSLNKPADELLTNSPSVILKVTEAYNSSF
jgi:hypothetical protein